MASLRNPNTWAPYIKTKDCSQGFCSLYCPQWCYIIYPPPPPTPSEFTDEDSGSMFSPLTITVIGVLGSAFLLLGYYVTVIKFCKKKRLRREQEIEEMEVIEHVPALQESWHFTANNGLDEALIKLITVCQYKRGDGLVEGTQCSVCLSEFEEGERLRLLPKCSHAFHLTCIDTWLKSHSNCPLCRANIICVTMAIAQSQQPPIEAEYSGPNQSDQQPQPRDESTAVRELSPGNFEEESIVAIATGNDTALKCQLFPESGMISDITVRRSVSMDCFSFSIADALRVNQAEEAHGRSDAEICKAGIGHVAMKRSFSSGIFLANKHAKRPNVTTLPL